MVCTASEPVQERPLRVPLRLDRQFCGIPVTAETRTVIEKLAVTLEQLGVAWSAATHQDLILPLHYRPSARFVEPRLATTPL